ncbi:MAG TPA: Pls/PosA family non-ribosomal peptide synthetase [Pseudonocardiaceae bacterium]|nr:Pls/PosA family non-ribosomal peptide synthetase [Pseudonocardiaceae bacterium]
MGNSAETETAGLTDTQAARNGHNTTESAFAEVLAEVVGVERVEVDSHFFDDLCANSLVMAHFCARVRKRDDLPSVSIKDIYRNPTISSLTTALAGGQQPVPVGQPPAPEPAEPEPMARAGSTAYWCCGALQLLFFLGYTYLVALVVSWAYGWIVAGSGLLDYYVRTVAFGGSLLLGLCVLPVVLKWVLVGRWKPGRIRVWSLAYLRFWVVKTLVQRNLVVVLCTGTPLYSWYLRALGAHVGRGTMIFSKHIPTCTDLIWIGDRTVIRKDSFVNGYRAHAGIVEFGPVRIGSDAFVGENTVIEIGAELGDGAQLGHTSSLQPGQRVPAGEHWHGSPAQPTTTDYRTVGPMPVGNVRRTCYTLHQMVIILGIYLPVTIGGVDVLLDQAPRMVMPLLAQRRAITTWPFYRDAMLVSAALFFGVSLLGLLAVYVVPRLCNAVLRPDRVYRLFGLHYSVHRAIRLMTNVHYFNTLFGDSSAILHYLRWAGYRLSKAEQTGSNFGTQVKHENPYLSTVGPGTMVADGLSVINADFSATSFRLSRATIGGHSFLGNLIAYPAQSRTGENCLLATKVLVPIDGEVREGVGLLGSPSFEIPRSVERDSRFEDLRGGDELRRRLHAKNRHNTVTVGMYLVARWLYFCAVLVIGWVTEVYYDQWTSAAVAAASVLLVAFSIGYFVLFERLVTWFLPVRPLYCSIYDRRFWRHERFWKAAAATAHLQFLNGTPFKAMAWRMLGARVGRRLFDDGASIPEKTIVTIGDDVTLNAGSTVQCHSQEDGAFKSDRIALGDGCTVGIGAWVHYGVTMGARTVLAADSFLMKGEDMPDDSWWGGNPAREIRAADREVFGHR